MKRFYRRGDVVFINREIDPDSCVQSGARPYVIVSNNIMNAYGGTVIVVPLTSKIKRTDLATHQVLRPYFLPVASMCMAEAIQTIDRRDGWEFLGALDSEDMAKVDYAIHQALYYIANDN